MNIKVWGTNHRDWEFYLRIAPFALDRNVTKELHDLKYGGIYDEDYATWFVAISENQETLGFAALFEKKKEIYLDHCFVSKENRGKGIGKKLFAKRLDVAKSIADGRPIKGITMNPVQYEIYLKHGFRLASKRGKYYWMVMDNEPTKII